MMGHLQVMYWKKYEIGQSLPVLRYYASHLHKGVKNFSWDCHPPDQDCNPGLLTYEAKVVTSTIAFIPGRIVVAGRWSANTT